MVSTGVQLTTSPIAGAYNKLCGAVTIIAFVALLSTVKLVMFACSKYCVFFIFSFMRVLINVNATRRQISETEGTDLCVF